EYLEYTVNVNSAGNYTFRVRGAVPNNAGISLSSNGTSKLSTNFNSTGGWGTFQTRSFTVNLSAGQQVLRLSKINNSGLNLDWIEFEKQGGGGGGGGGGQSVFGNGGNPRSINGNSTRRIQAEDFDNGGQGVAYNDSDAVNSGGVNVRSDSPGVDLATVSGNNEFVGWFGNGEWLEYTVNVTEAGTYTFRTRTAQPNSGTFQLRSGSNVLGTYTTGSTGSWSSFQTQNFSVNLSTGTQVLQFRKTGGNLNLDWIEFQKSNGGGGGGGSANGLISESQLDNRGADYAFTDALLTNQGTLNSDIQNQYNEWRNKFVKSPSQSYINQNGGGTMYFITGFDQSFAGINNGAVSEGLGYGLIAAALADDKPTFD
ncbi:MAG: carbohydrate-binding protein, partial [Planctomycetota bacterium]